MVSLALVFWLAWLCGNELFSEMLASIGLFLFFFPLGGIRQCENGSKLGVGRIMSVSLNSSWGSLHRNDI